MSERKWVIGNEISYILLMVFFVLAAGCRSCPRLPDSYNVYKTMLERSQKEDLFTEEKFSDFIDMDMRLTDSEAIGCRTFRNEKLYGTTFQIEYDRQKIFAAENAVVEAEKERITIERLKDQAKAREDWKRDIEVRAQKAGFRKVLFDKSLTQALWAVVYGYATLESLNGVVIELDDFYDGEYQVMQSIGTAALYSSTRDKAPLIFLKGVQGTLVQGSALPTIESSYVTVLGQKSYETVIGTNTAIIVEMVF